MPAVIKSAPKKKMKKSSSDLTSKSKKSTSYVNLKNKKTESLQKPAVTKNTLDKKSEKKR